MKIAKGQRRRLPDRVADAMEAILDYLWEDEAMDWLTRSREEQSHHVFGHMLTVRKWLDDESQRHRRKEGPK